MKFGVREICDVVLKAKKSMKIGTMTFEKDMPVFYFDSLKTSTLESAATTVYAQGGKGNSRLIAWEGEKTVTFTMEDALISALSLSILSGAGIIEKGSKENMTPVHVTETIEVVDGGKTETSKVAINNNDTFKTYLIPLDDNGDIEGAPYKVTVSYDMSPVSKNSNGKYDATIETNSVAVEAGIYLIDYYYNTTSKVTQIDITPDKFAGNYYLEAATLFRDKDGVDLPAEFIIPNCKIQSNFTFTMASSGDPSTFTFTMDAFPDYTMYDKTKKVLAAIQILHDSPEDDEDYKVKEASLTYNSSDLDTTVEATLNGETATFKRVDVSKSVDLNTDYYTINDDKEATEATSVNDTDLFYVKVTTVNSGVYSRRKSTISNEI